MKKIILLAVTAILLGVILTSCHQTQPCPAYNSYKHYQKESAF